MLESGRFVVPEIVTGGEDRHSVGHFLNVRRPVTFGRTLGERGVSASDLRQLTKAAMLDSAMVTTPPLPTPCASENIYAKAL